jgi:hypothetical protein
VLITELCEGAGADCCSDVPAELFRDDFRKNNDNPRAIASTAATKINNAPLVFGVAGAVFGVDGATAGAAATPPLFVEEEERVASDLPHDWQKTESSGSVFPQKRQNMGILQRRLSGHKRILALAECQL